jgi:hypothetical protein
MTKTKYNQIGSSETICETTFDFSDYQKVVPEHKNKLNKEFLTYFIGFFEGDGSLLMNYKRGSVEFVLDQHSNELAFLNNLRTTLGYGKVIRLKTRNMGRLFIGNEKNLLKIIHLLNGNLSIPTRREQFGDFLTMYNTKYGTNIEFKNYGPSVSLNTSWLCGFTDAEGCFMLNIRQKKDGVVSVRARYSITQKTEPIITAIRNLFVKTDTNKRYDPSWEGYEFYIGNKKARVKLIQYFQRYKLKTKKRIAYLHWRNAHHLIVKKIHLTVEGYRIIEKIAGKLKNINQKLKIESDLTRNGKDVLPNEGSSNING